MSLSSTSSIWIVLVSCGALGLAASLTRCAEGSVPMDSGPPPPTCEDAGGKPGMGCPCNPDKYAPTVCYSGPLGTVAKGICKSGMRSCNADTRTLGPCDGEVTPKPETCNLVDDDCNGTVDDVPGVANTNPIGWCTSPGCDPDHGDAAITCFAPTRMGVCGAGALACGAGGKLDCKAFGVTPSDEICNALDDDCDGIVDNLMMDEGPCDVDGGIGECTHGSMKCVSGSEVCTQGMPAMETCDGKDNDCNGKTDEKTCTSGNAIYCCQNLQSAWGCTSTPNDGQHSNCKVGL